MQYKIFTVQDGTVEHGARLQTVQVGNPAVQIKAIAVGEKGRNRTLAILPVTGVDGDVVYHAGITKSLSGRPKLTCDNSRVDTSAAIVVLRTSIGFRGGNSHEGLREGDPLPGKILVVGTIAQGAAGRMGSGQQLVLLLPKGEVIKICRQGRLYGKPGKHLAVYNGHHLFVGTPEEFELATDTPATWGGGDEGADEVDQTPPWE